MRLPSPKLLAVAVLALGTLGLVANEVAASTPTVKGRGKLFLSFAEIITATAPINAVVEVPAKQVFVLTDIIATNTAGTNNTFGLRCLLAGGGTHDLLPLITVPANGTFTHSFGTGMECAELDTLRMVPGATGATLKVVCVGYFRKGL